MATRIQAFGYSSKTVVLPPPPPVEQREAQPSEVEEALALINRGGDDLDLLRKELETTQAEANALRARVAFLETTARKGFQLTDGGQALRDALLASEERVAQLQAQLEQALTRPDHTTVREDLERRVQAQAAELATLRVELAHERTTHRAYTTGKEEVSLRWPGLGRSPRPQPSLVAAEPQRTLQGRDLRTPSTLTREDLEATVYRSPRDVLLIHRRIRHQQWERAALEAFTYVNPELERLSPRIARHCRALQMTMNELQVDQDHPPIDFRPLTYRY
jgi:hypothetical protein